MTTPESKDTKLLGLRLTLFRALGGILLTFAILGLVSVAIGVYFTWMESSKSSWFPPVLIAGVGIGVLAMGIVGVRALRIKSIEELEAQSKSKWLDL